MLSKNNFKEKLRKMEQKTERFSIRKLTIGTASVLIGLSFLGFNSHTAKADTTSSNEDIANKGNVTTAEKTVKESNSTATGLKFTDAAQTKENTVVQPSESSEVTNTQDASTKEKTAANNVTNMSKKEAAEKIAKNNKTLVATNSTASATHTNGTGGYTQDGIRVPSVTEPEASQFWNELNQEIKPLSTEDLAKLGLDENTFYESANNKTKWHAVGWLELQNTEGKSVNVGTFLYHNQNGTLAKVFNDKWLSDSVTQAILNIDNNSFDSYNYIQHASLVPIISNTSTIYLNKGVALSYNDIRRALASNAESITGLVSGDWVTDEQAQGVKVVDVNKAGLQEGAVRLTYINGTKTSALINVDVVDLKGQTTYVNVNSPLPDADTVISGQPAGSKDIKWITMPDLSKTGVSTGVVQVTYPDNSTGTATVTFNVENPQGKDITIHVGQDVTPNDVVVSNTYPAGSTITWVTEPNNDIAGKQNVSVVVTYPNGISSHEIPAVITVIAPKGQDITTPNGEVPSAEKGISNVPEMPAGTKYNWKTTPEVKTPGKKPAVVVVTFPDGKSVDVPVTVTVEDPTPKGQDITTPNGEVPSAEKGISNVPEMPAGTKYEWQTTPEVKTPGKKPAVVVVTFPDGKSVDVPVNVTVEDPIPKGQDITTPNGEVPSAEKGISNVPEMPAGTKYEWKDVPDVTTPGKKPAVVVVTFPDGKTVDVPVTVTVTESVPQPHVTTPEPEGQDITTPYGKVPSAEEGISNVPEMPEGTKYNWQTTPDVKTPGKKPAVVVVTFPDGKSVDVPVNVTVEDPIPEGQDITTPNGKVPEAETAIGNVPEMPEGTKYEWKTTPEVKTPGKKPAVVVVTFPDGKTVDVPITVTVEDPIPEGQPINTDKGHMPNPGDGIGNKGDMPNGTKYEWADGEPDVNTPGTHDVTIKVIFPDGSSTLVHTTIVVHDTDKGTVTPSDNNNNGNGVAPAAHQTTVVKSNGNVAHTNFYNTTKSNSKTLPQTGAEANMAGLLGLMIASVGAILGLAADKKRKN